MNGQRTPTIIVLLLIAASLCVPGHVEAISPAPPHTDYRPGYLGGCGGGTACHTFPKTTFLPQQLDTTPYPPNDYTVFCLSCHNAAGEAHGKPVGTPSTNAYINFTGLDLSLTYGGDSHSWNGRIGNASTRMPAAAGFRGTTTTPGGLVRCQTCHAPMEKSFEQEVALPNPPYGYGAWWPTTNPSSDQKNYRISGYTSTKQYLAQYLKVFRTATPFYPGPTSRAAKAYQVYTGFTYSYQTATITFNRPQGSASIYVWIPQPYLRVGNESNAICIDCHNNRISSAVPHAPGTGARSNHPTGVIYGHTFGSHTTLRNITAVKIYLEYTAGIGYRVLCTTCHKPHNAPGRNGSILREPDPSALCMDCHDRGKVAEHKGASHPKYQNTSSIPTGCTECHGAHGSQNIYLVRSRLKTPSGNVARIKFQNFSGYTSFGNGLGGSLCEVCHTGLNHHNAGVTDSSLHHNNDNCLKCHSHKNGFEPMGGKAPCYGCHDGSIAPNIKALMGLGTSFAHGGKTSRHIIAYDNTTSSSCLSMCHTSNHNSGSPNMKTAPELTLCSSCHSSAGLTSRGDSINVMASFRASLHNFTTATVSEMSPVFNYEANCTKCHIPHGSDNYPILRASIYGKTTNGDTQDLCFGCHDSSRIKGAIDIKDLWEANPAVNRGHYDYKAGTQMNCVKCHGPHGTGNDKMIKLDGYSGLVGNNICLICHSGSQSGYSGRSVYNVMTSAPGEYGPGFTAGSVHKFGLNVAPNGKTVDLTCTGCHDPHNTENARLLQDKVVFSGISSVAVPPVSAVVQPQGRIISYTGGWTTYCVICHTSLTDTGGQSPYRRHPTGIAPPSFYPYTTGMGIKTLPLESGNVACITCHYTHGSPKTKLQRIQSASTPDNRLCLQCHDKIQFLQGGQGSHGGFMENQGRCADCHNMHDLANKRLLVEATESVLCERCHASGGISKYDVWKTLTSISPYEMYGTAGTFGRYSGSRGGTSASMHLVNEEDLPAPGGVTTQHRCGTCHNPHGSTNYRILRTTVNNISGLFVYAKRDANDKFIGYSSGFTRFCTACHTSYKVTTDAAGNIIRHPVGVYLANYTAQLNFFVNSTSYKPKVELESGNKIACVTCHYAHGSPQNANLKYPGGKTVNTCKTCHNRNFNAGQPGSHAGFTDDNGTCSDCHSMHKGANPTLLNYSTETEICVNCHDYPGTSTSPNHSHLDVWKGNVFDNPSSWLETAGSFGAYDPVNGGNAPSMHPVNSGALIAPGDSATVVHCATCHNPHGSPNYRLLKTSLNGKSGIAVAATVDSRGNTVAHISGMSSFCTACHKAYINYGSPAGYTRHPVDVPLTPDQQKAYAYFGGSRYLPLEANNSVTCITCHFAHGSPNPHMLRMTVPQLCQTCHAKGLKYDTNLKSYRQVTHTHGGFSGNGGNCFACHYVHRRYNNVTSSVVNRKMLRDPEENHLCYSCHAQSGENYGSFLNAPVVWKGDAPTSPGDWDGTGGSFGAFYNTSTGGSIASHHKINKTDSPAPGGSTVTHYCGTCHNPHGNDNYRLLRDDVNGQASGSIIVNATTVAGRSVYRSGISNFCTSCHTTYGQTGTGVDGYNRHPVNLPLSSQEMTNISTSGYEPKAQTESRGVMCLSCHYAHGSPSYAMLRMPTYTSSQSAICQQCHKKGYNAAGKQVRHTHGGFAGDDANCGVCHSVHAKNNKKLLMEPEEENLCRDCHSGYANFTSFKRRSPEVKLSAPSRYNVFTSIGNSFGLYSAGGGGVKSWHKVDAYGTAPGGLTLNLRCGKCHNPHGEDNFVMIRSTIENVTGIKVFGHLSSASATAQFNTYSSGFGKFCSACHTRLTNCGTGNPWTRHPVDFRLKSTELHNWSTTKITPRVPTETGSQVTCITCHNSHGSKNYRLMRLPGNGMCQQCHNR